jgi:16S rRNA (guanine966-N2)-methyltransferase
MRIIAGQWRGRRIKPPPDGNIRPTGDRVREAWMSIVNPALPGARVLDLFAGTGALGLEALSRGAAAVDFVETSPASITLLTENIATLGAGASATVHGDDAFRFVAGLAPSAYDVAFADPPYDLGFATRLAEQWLATPFAETFGVEHRIDESLPGNGERRRYGATVVTLYRL